MASRHELRARHTEEKQKQNPQELFKRNMAVAALVGMTAAAAIGVFAGTYYIDNGDITIEGDQITYYEDDKTTQKTETDTDITITQHEDVEVTDNTVTIKADENETVEVTLEDIHIEATEQIDEDRSWLLRDNHKAAITVEGKGDVVLELNGENEVKSGCFHAGVETTEGGVLTIQDETGDGGSLTAAAGRGSAAIGSGNFDTELIYDEKDRIVEESNIVINGGKIMAAGGYGGSAIGGATYGTANVTINGGEVMASAFNGSGVTIGGGLYANSDVTINGGTIWATGKIGSSNNSYDTITINGGNLQLEGQLGNSAAVTDITINDGVISVNGKSEENQSMAIGGSSGESNVTINGGTVIAVGGDGGIVGCPGIGGMGSKTTVMINGGTVTATAGKSKRTNKNPDAIGTTYSNKEKATVTMTDGIIIEQPSGWDADGHTHNFANAVEELCKTVETCACGSIKTTFTHIWDGGVVTKHPTTTEEGTRTYTCKTCSLTRTESIPKLAGTSASAAALTVTTLSGTAQPYEQSMADGRALFAAPAQDAILTGSLSALAELKAQGATMLVFRTWQCETSVSIDKLFATGSEDEVFVLTHKGTEAVLTVEGRVVE